MPSPAEDYEDEKLDLNQYLEMSREHTFIMRVNNNEMYQHGINKDALIVVNRSQTPRHNQLVLVQMEDERVIRKLVIKNNKFYLLSGHAQNFLGFLTEETDVTILGVVTAIIHSL